SPVAPATGAIVTCPTAVRLSGRSTMTVSRYVPAQMRTSSPSLAVAIAAARDRYPGAVQLLPGLDADAPVTVPTQCTVGIPAGASACAVPEPATRSRQAASTPATQIGLFATRCIAELLPAARRAAACSAAGA